MRMIHHVYKPQRKRIEAIEKERRQRKREEQKKLNLAKFKQGVNND